MKEYFILTLENISKINLNKNNIPTKILISRSIQHKMYTQ